MVPLRFSKNCGSLMVLVHFLSRKCERLHTVGEEDRDRRFAQGEQRAAAEDGRGFDGCWVCRRWSRLGESGWMGGSGIQPEVVWNGELTLASGALVG